MAELSQRYYQQYIEAAESHWWFRGRERVLVSVAAAAAGLRPGSVIVDVGSGPGGPARTIFPEARIVAVDVSTTVLQAHARADERIAADASWLPLRSASVQAICAFDVLEHLDDDRAALEEWRRALAPGGWLMLTVPAYEQLWSAHDEVNGHRRRYRAGGLRRLLTSAGFAVARLTYFNTLLLPGIAMVRWELDCQKRMPGWLERWCEGALRLEARWLRGRGLPTGVSLCAVANVPQSSLG
jgi:SAM-dependent methyltransferase